MNICYIQARGGSKRFPHKNLALWNGRPMVADAIEKAKAAGLFEIIAVSSDDSEILRVAHDYGVLPLWRTPEASSDTATDDDVFKEIIKYFPKAENICKLYPCIPLLTVDNIMFLANLFDSTSAIHGGMYYTDDDGKDSGSIYLFRKSVYDRIGSIALNVFPWGKLPLYYSNCQDINTIQDYEKAKQKAGMA